MEKGKNVGLIILIIILAILVAGLGGYLVYDKVLKDGIQPDITTKTTTKKTNEKPYTVVMSDICPTSGECFKDLADITLGDKTYKASVKIYDEDSWNGENSDYVTVDNKKLDTEENAFIKFLAVMNNEYLVVGTNHIAPGDVYYLMIYDKNLNKVETYASYNHQSGYDVSINLRKNNTEFIYNDCTVPSTIDDDNYENSQTLTTYEVKFAAGNFTKEQINVINNTFCTSEVH